MHTPLKFNRNLIPNLNLPSFPSLIKIEHARNDAGTAVQLRMLRPRSLNIIQLYHHPKIHKNSNRVNFQIVKPVIFAQRTTSMADTKEVEKTEIQTKTTTTEKEAEEKIERPSKKKELPVPPEKPEAGDCCGSGCVRCVWDIYYDELDAYDQLLKEFNQSS